MQCGLSTACFFPETTLSSLEQVIESKVPVAELFLNTFSELEDAYVERIISALQNSTTKIVSVHPFSSTMEGFFFATPYEGRFSDGLYLYRKIFDATQKIGASKVVFHGDHVQNSTKFPLKDYVRNFSILVEEAQKYGITLCHENVSYCRLNTPQAVHDFTECYFKETTLQPNFVLDTKQAHRNNVPVIEMAKAMGKNIAHIHISDYTSTESCLVPGKGYFDFTILFDYLKEIKYQGDIVLELYRDGFSSVSDLLNGVSYIEQFL